MLNSEQIYLNKMQWLKLLQENTNADLTPFVKYLESPRADYFNKPYNTYTEGAYDGALCEHSLKLCSELFKVVNTYRPNVYSDEDIIKVALLAELYKAELFESYNRNQKNDITGQWETVKAYRNKEDRPTFGDIGLSTYMIAKKFFDLTDEQAMSIIYATNELIPMDSYLIKKEYPLVNLIQMAEKAVNFLM